MPRSLTGPPAAGPGDEAAREASPSRLAGVSLNPGGAATFSGGSHHRPSSGNLAGGSADAQALGSVLWGEPQGPSGSDQVRLRHSSPTPDGTMVAVRYRQKLSHGIPCRKLLSLPPVSSARWLLTTLPATLSMRQTRAASSWRLKCPTACLQALLTVRLLQAEAPHHVGPTPVCLMAEILMASDCAGAPAFAVTTAAVAAKAQNPPSLAHSQLAHSARCCLYPIEAS